MYRVDMLETRIRAVLYPPQRQLFVPQDEVAMVVNATLAAMNATPTPTQTATPSITPTHPPDLPTPTPTFTPKPTITPTPLPTVVALKGVRYYDQHAAWNYCAPATLAMELSYWGWKGTREDVGTYVKPFSEDKNVMPYELANYVEEKTKLGVIVRPGGTLNLLKALTAGGFPVMIEKGAFIEESATKLTTWMGHYAVVSGYSEPTSQFITQDSYYRADYTVTYADLEAGWRAFNYIFLIVYAPEQKEKLFSILGPYADENAAYKIAMKTASDEYAKMLSLDRFFALYNYGTSLNHFEDYGGAAKAYDEALLKLYPNLNMPQEKLPFRMLWYQTGPYFTYFYLGRYYDVISLATETIDTADKRTGKPYIEESFLLARQGARRFG